MRKELFFVEVGVLLNKEHPEFDCYKIRNFYEEFGFYDENKLTFLTYKEAENYANEYIDDGVNTTYGIVYSEFCKITDEELQEIKDYAYCEYSLEPPEHDTTLYFAYKKDNGETKIVKGDNK